MRRLLLLAVVAASCTGRSSSAPTETPPPSCAIAVPALSTWRLKIDGTKLRDALGRLVILRGVNAGGRSKLAPYVPFDYPADGFQRALDAYLDRAASFGFDVLRVPFTWAAFEPKEGTFDEAWAAKYDALLDGAWKRGMRTIVDAHQDIYAEALCGDGFPDWTLWDPKPTPKKSCADWFTHYGFDANVKKAFDRFWANEGGVRTKFFAMWERMAARHKDRAGVLGFEIINEPTVGGASKSTFSVDVLGPFFDDIGKRLHAISPDALVFFESPVEESVDHSTKLKTPSGGYWVFAPHWYDVSVFLGTEPKLERVREPLAKWVAVGNALGTPLLIGESGARNHSEHAPALVRATYDAMDDLGMHFTYWEYSTATEIWNEERFSIVNADGSDIPLITTEIARPYPRAIAGDDPKFRFDASTRTFTLSYAGNAGGVTEVMVPARAFPNGTRVTLTGGCVDGSQPGVLLVRGEGKRVELTVAGR